MRTRLVGILNLTPDSFSDGGLYVGVDSMRAQAEALVTAGASVIDVGAESTRPGATPMDAESEWQRLAPFMDRILPELQGRVAVSVDTRHADTAERALRCGVHWINDVSGFSDPAMVDALVSEDAMLVVMHSLSVPADPAVMLSADADPVQELIAFAEARIEALVKAGIARERLIFDPGLGFGKTAEQSLEIVRRMRELKILRVPLLVGHSRKSFLKLVDADRDAATLSVSRMLAASGVEYLRVHDVAAHRNLA